MHSTGEVPALIFTANDFGTRTSACWIRLPTSRRNGGGSGFRRTYTPVCLWKHRCRCPEQGFYPPGIPFRFKLTSRKYRPVLMRKISKGPLLHLWSDILRMTTNWKRCWARDLSGWYRRSNNNQPLELCLLLKKRPHAGD